jgi:hypothetical protein
MTTVAEQVKKVPLAVRPTLQAAIRMVRQIAPGAEEIVYAMEAPKSARMVWKHVRFAIDGNEVVGIGTLPDHVDIWFYRGRELDDGGVKLKGSGKDTRFINLRTPADAEGAQLQKLTRKAFKLARGGSKAE